MSHPTVCKWVVFLWKMSKIAGWGTLVTDNIGDKSFLTTISGAYLETLWLYSDTF